MRVWLVTVGEPLPLDGRDKRLLRAGILADLLSARGHEVVWWSSTFDHVLKAHRFDKDTIVDRSERYRLILLHSIGYRRNVSLRRIADHIGIARKFERMSVMQAPPDIILCSFPTIELSMAATRYGKRFGVPVVLDIRDLWPDIFVELAPPWLRAPVRALLAPLFAMTRHACRDAAAITGTTTSFIAWAAAYAGRATTEWDRPFPMGYSSSIPEKEDQDAARARWHARGIRPEDFNICFFGTLGRQFELETVIDAARMLEAQHRPFRFILCGDGDRSEEYRSLAAGCRSVIFPGWVNSSDIWTLMRMSRVGLAPYPSNANFMLNMPNKPLEYFSAGLPILSSLQGILKDLLEEGGCGVTYPNGDAQSLADTLIRLHDDPRMLEEMSRKAQALFHERFTADKVYGELIGYLVSVASSYRRGALTP